MKANVNRLSARESDLRTKMEGHRRCCFQPTKGRVARIGRFCLGGSVSSRNVAMTQDASTLGFSKSNVSRHWKKVGHQFVDRLRGHNLSVKDWAILMLDGIHLSQDQTAIVALGITTVRGPR